MPNTNILEIFELSLCQFISMVDGHIMTTKVGFNGLGKSRYKVNTANLSLFTPFLSLFTPVSLEALNQNSVEEFQFYCFVNL